MSAAAESGVGGWAMSEGMQRDTAIEEVVCGYLMATEGDLAAALRIAIADLLDVRDEAAWRQLALDQWVSRGYVRGPAAEVLQRPQARRALATGADALAFKSA